MVGLARVIISNYLGINSTSTHDPWLAKSPNPTTSIFLVSWNLTSNLVKAHYAGVEASFQYERNVYKGMGIFLFNR